MKANAQYSTTGLWQYGFMALPLAFAGLPLYVHAPDYYATEYGVSLSALGSLLLLIRLVDSIQDPLIGYFSDRLAQYRLAIMIFGVLLLGSGFTALFWPNNDYLLPWFVLSLIISTTGFSIVTINLTALGALWHPGSHEKTKISVFREGFGLVGLLLATLLPSILLLKMPAQSAFGWVSSLLVCLLCVSTYTLVRWYFSNPQLHFSKAHSLSFSFLSQLKALSVETKKLLSVYALSMIASSLPAILVIFFIRDYLNLASLTGLFLTIYFLSAAVGLIFWQYMSRIYSKPSAWAASLVLSVISFIWVLCLKEGDALFYGLICFFSGFALGAELSLPPALLADFIERNQQKKQASFQNSLLTLLTKSCMAIGASVSFFLLDLAQFEPNTNNADHARWALCLIYGGVPCLLKSLALCLLWHYRPSLTYGDQHDQINQNLVTRS